MIETLQNEHWAVRWKAVEVLGEIGDKRAVEPLKVLLAKEIK